MLMLIALFINVMGEQPLDSENERFPSSTSQNHPRDHQLQKNLNVYKGSSRDRIRLIIDRERNRHTSKMPYTDTPPSSDQDIPDKVDTDNDPLNNENKMNWLTRILLFVGVGVVLGFVAYCLLLLFTSVTGDPNIVTSDLRCK